MLIHKLSNYALVNVQRLLRLKRVYGLPYHVVLDPTNVCQLKCPFCGTGERRPSMLKFDGFKKIIDEIGKTCINLELYNWGEPFLNKDVLEMVSYASNKYGTYVRISSNLNVRNDELNRDLVLSGLNTLTISLDGASQETYEKYRVAGSFDKVIENFETYTRPETGVIKAVIEVS